MENIWLFVVEDLKGFKEVEILGAFIEPPAGRALLKVMGEHSGINLVREFKDQEGFLNESMDGLTEFTIDEERYTVHKVEVS